MFKSNSDFSATFNFQPVFLFTWSTVMPGCNCTKVSSNVSGSGCKIPRSVITADGPLPIKPKRWRDCGPSFIKFCQLRKKYQHFSLALRASFLIEFLTVFSCRLKERKSFLIYPLKKPVYMLLLISITIHISFKVTQNLTT